MAQFYPGETYKMENGRKAKLHFELSEPTRTLYTIIGEYQTRDGIWISGGWSKDGESQIPSHNLQHPEIRTYGNVYTSPGDAVTSVVYWHQTLESARNSVANSDLMYVHRLCRITRGDEVWYEVVEEEKG